MDSERIAFTTAPRKLSDGNYGNVKSFVSASAQNPVRKSKSLPKNHLDGDYIPVDFAGRFLYAGLINKLQGRAVTEKGRLVPIKGFLETSFVDWPDKIAAMIFLPSCNFKCPYCHNPELVKEPHTLLDLDIDEILGRLKKFEGWIDGICITGGEPTIHKRLPELIGYIRGKVDMLIKLDTNGTNPKMLDRLINERLIDAVSMDIKAPLDDIRYFKAAGTAVALDDIKKSIDILRDSGLDVELRTTIHPRLFMRQDIIDLAEQLRQMGWRERFKLQNFNKNAETLDPSMKGTEPFSEDEFNELCELVERIIHEEPA